MAEQFKITITNIIWSFDRDRHQVNLLLVRRADQPFSQFWHCPKQRCALTKVPMRLLCD